MSTPSEKNPALVELSDYLARQMREPVSSEPEHPVETESDLPRSPYAPKSPHERAAARLRVLANNEGDPHSSPYAPKRARLSEAEPSFGPDGEPVASSREARYATATPLAHSEDVASVNAPSLSPDRASAGSSHLGETPPDKDGPANESRISARAHSDKHPADPGAISAFPPARAHNMKQPSPRRVKYGAGSLPTRSLRGSKPVCGCCSIDKSQGCAFLAGPTLPFRATQRSLLGIQWRGATASARR